MTLSEGSSNPAADVAWTPPRLQLASTEPEPEPIDPVAVAEEARRRGHAAGYEAGFAEGAAAGRTLAENIAEEMGTLLASAAAPYRELDATLMADLVSLVERASTAVVLRELETGAADIEALLRDAMRVLGDARGRVEITLHPRDAVLLREAGLDLDEYALVEDRQMQRGGMHLSSASSFVDAGIDTRLQAVFEAFRESAALPDPAQDA